MLKVCVLYPDLLGTYGDGGNGLVVVERARRRGITSELVEARAGDPVPEASLYLLGGGEDGPQRHACDLLAQSSFGERVRDGAYVVAVCAGLQILGHSFAVAGSDEYDGLGLVDLATRRGSVRSVGDLALRVGENYLVGFENHGGVTALGASVGPLGTVVRGRGNDGAVDGFRTERLWGTYAHGPVLAMNPWWADEILSTVLSQPLDPLESVADDLYRERCRALTLE